MTKVNEVPPLRPIFPRREPERRDSTTPPVTPKARKPAGTRPGAPPPGAPPQLDEFA